MNPQKPTSLNDDRIHTWTVSSALVDWKTQALELTMREKLRGLIAGVLSNAVRKLKKSMTHAMNDFSVLGMTPRLVAGVAGHFVLLPIQRSTAENLKLLFVAGRIGTTQFLSMLKAIREMSKERDVVLLISTGGPIKVLLNLVAEAISSLSIGVRLVVHVFSSQETLNLGTPAES